MLIVVGEVGVEEIRGGGIDDEVVEIEVEGTGIIGMGGNVTGVEKIGGAGMEVEGVEVEGIGGIGVEVRVDEGIKVDVLDLGGKLQHLTGRRGFFREKDSLESKEYDVETKKIYGAKLSQ